MSDGDYVQRRMERALDQAIEIEERANEVLAEYDILGNPEWRYDS